MRSLKRLNPDEQKKEDETNSAKVLGGMAREWMSEETKFLESKAISAEKEADILKEKLAEAGGDFDLDYPNKVGFEQIDSEGDVVSYRKFEELAKDYLSECEDRSDLPRSLVEDLGAYWRKKSLAESKRSRIEQWDRLSPEELSRKYYAAAIKWLKQGVVSARSDIKGYQREINRLSPIAKTYPIIYKEQLLENSQILKEEIKNQARFQCEQALRDFAFGKIGKMETSWGEGDEYSFRYDFVSRDGTRKTGSFRDNVFAGDNIEYEEIEYFVDALRSSLGDTVNQIDDNVLFLTDKDSLLTDVKAPDEIRDKKGARQFQYFYQLQVDLEREFLDRGNLRYLDQTEGNIGPLIEKVKEMQIFKDIVESKASRETFYCVMDDGRDIRVSGHPAFSSVADEYVWIPFCNNDEELLDKLKDAADKLRDMG